MDSNPFIDGYCDVSVINQENCTNDVYDLSWSIIDDVGIDGLMVIQQMKIKIVILVQMKMILATQKIVKVKVTV